MTSRLEQLHDYPFEKLRALLAGAAEPSGLAPIKWSIGEPKHPPAPVALAALAEALPAVGRYPATRGTGELRAALAAWLEGRFGLASGGLDPERQVLPCSGTREALFAVVQALYEPRPGGAIAMPNPFYQIYEGATLLAGAEPIYLPCPAEGGYLPDWRRLSEQDWRRIQMMFICSPGNPTGAVLGRAELSELLELAERHEVILLSDECYSEIYHDERAPPAGLLEACAATGRDDFRRCLVFHSLSKRSNLPGLRSGLVAGDAGLIAPFMRYRMYHGAAMPLHHQRASVAAWGDEGHVVENRARYREKFSRVLEALGGALDTRRPDASFYLWAKTPICDREFTRRLFEQQRLTVLPGSYLSREVDGVDPGRGHVRLALVAELAECEEAARRLRAFVEGLR
jgi:N-succinyldiaminopimelate aminotransferase